MTCAHTNFQPHDTARPKVDAVRAYGAEITFCEPNIQARVAMVAEVQARTGATFVSPDDAVNTILGQGTAALELIKQAPEPLAAIVAPVGGGGLLAGSALAAEGTSVCVFGAEPAGADDCARGLKEGTRREDVQAKTIADGLRTPVGKLNFPIIQEKVERVIVVTDEVREDFLGAISLTSLIMLRPLGDSGCDASYVGTPEARRRTEWRSCSCSRPKQGVPRT